MKSTLCCLLVLGVMGMSGCAATQNNFASKVKSEGAQNLDLSQQWEQGDKDVRNGKEQLQDGRKLVQEGSTEIREGEKLIAEARIEGQKQKQAFLSFTSALNGAPTGKRAIELLNKLEEIADLWEDADDKFADGKELVEDGNTKLAEGESAIEQGQNLINSGSSRMKQAEGKYQQRNGSGLVEQRREDKALVEQMHIEERSNNF